MRKTKRIIGILLVVVLMLGAVSVSATTVQAKTYWVTGGYGNSSLKYTGKKFKFTGKWGKGATMEKSVEKYYTNPAKFKKTFKKAKKVKTGSIGSEGLIYDSKPQLEKNKEMVGITIHVKIKNKKVVSVIVSAM